MASPDLFISVIQIFISLSFQLFHKIAWFFGTINGGLLKNIIEFIVYTIVSYMLMKMLLNLSTITSMSSLILQQSPQTQESLLSITLTTAKNMLYSTVYMEEE